MTTPIEAVAVVVPAHNEEELLGGCLAALEIAALAARALLPRVEVCVVLDACDDRSADIAAAAGVRTMVVDAHCVGAARAAGVASVLARLADVPLARIWTAHTDADSAVPAHWLTHQLRLARAGADVIVGTVRPDFRDLTAAQRAAWWRTHTPGTANGHVHGANLGVRADALLDAGGFAPAATHEDVWLVDALRARERQVVASDAAWVRTSGRPIGRAPGGYARYLREDLIALAEGLTKEEAPCSPHSHSIAR